MNIIKAILPDSSSQLFKAQFCCDPETYLVQGQLPSARNCFPLSGRTSCVYGGERPAGALGKGQMCNKRGIVHTLIRLPGAAGVGTAKEGSELEAPKIARVRLVAGLGS